MGSIQEQADAQDAEKRDVTILVTGFGPFQGKWPVNPSFEITRDLPEFLPSKAPDRPSVRIISYPSPIRVAYEEVKELSPRTHDSYNGIIDIVLHIGMASGRKFYCMERYGHRDGYQRSKDLDGKMPASDEGPTRFQDCPIVMTTSLDFEALLLNWQVNILDIRKGEPGAEADIRPSENAGRYLCDYIYFNSLAYFGRKSGVMKGGKASDRPVLFFHVPPESDEQALERGKAVTVALIRAMADTFYKQKQQGGGSVA